MATSGTYAFNPSNADIVIEAFSRCGLRGNKVDIQMLIEASSSFNYIFSSWSNKGILLYTVDLKSVALTAGVAELTLDADTTQILTAYIEIGSPPTGLEITPIDRNTYASIPNKTTAGRPTQYWVNRLATPILTLWPVPDVSATYTLKYYRFRRLQDVNLTMAETADLIYRYLDAAAAELAARLAIKFAPDRYQQLRAEADLAFSRAFLEDQEEMTLTIAPDASGYFR
jgi:hypothetical protein